MSSVPITLGTTSAPAESIFSGGMPMNSSQPLLTAAWSCDPRSIGPMDPSEVNRSSDPPNLSEYTSLNENEESLGGYSFLSRFYRDPRLQNPVEREMCRGVNSPNTRIYDVRLVEVVNVGREYYMKSAYEGYEFYHRIGLKTLNQPPISVLAQATVTVICRYSQRKLKLLDVILTKLSKKLRLGPLKAYDMSHIVNDFINDLPFEENPVYNGLSPISSAMPYSDFLKNISERANRVLRSIPVPFFVSGFHDKDGNLPISYLEKGRNIDLTMGDYSQVSTQEIPTTVYKRIERELDAPIVYQSGAARQAREAKRREAAKKKAKPCPTKQEKKRRDILRKKERDQITNQSGLLSGVYSKVKDIVGYPMRIMRKSEALLDAAYSASISVPSEIIGAAGGVNRVSTAAAISMESVNDVFRNLCDVFRDLYEAFKKNLPRVIVATLFVAFIWWISRTNLAPMMRKLLIAVCRPYFPDPDVVEVFQGDNIENQSGSTSSLPRALTMTLLAVIVGTKRSSYLSSLSGHVLSAVGKAPRAFAGMESLFEYTVGLVETAINAVRGWLMMPRIRLLNKWNERVYELCDKIYALKQREVSDEVTDIPVPQRYAEMRSAYIDLQDCFSIYADNKDAMQFLKGVERDLDSIMKPLAATMGTGKGTKPMPTVLMLYGEPGVGKTSGILSLSCVILKLAGLLADGATEEDAHRNVYTKAKNTPYLEGYWGQPIFCIDDLCAKKPTVNDDTNDVMDIMTYVSSFTTMLNMATLENKGKWPFTSPLIMATTNLKNLEEVGMSGILLCPDAFKRRIDVHYEMVVRDEFRKPNSHELDWEKYAVEAFKCQEWVEKEIQEGRKPSILKAYPFHVWKAFPRKFDDHMEGHRSGDGVSFLRVIADVVDLLKRRRKQYEKECVSLATLMKCEQCSTEEINEMATSDEEAHSTGRTFSHVRERVRVIENQSGFSLTNAFSRVENTLWPDSEDEEFVDCEEQPYRFCWHAICSATDEFFSTLFGWNRSSSNLKSKSDVQFSTKCWDLAVGALIMSMLVGCGVVLRSATKLVVAICKGVWNFIKETFFGEDVHAQSNRRRDQVVKFGIAKQSGKHVKDIPLHLKCYENTYKAIVWINPTTYQVLGQILFLKNTSFVMPHHYIADLDALRSEGLVNGNSNIEFVHCGLSNHSHLCSVDNFLSLPHHIIREQDLWFSSFRNAFSPKKDITSFLIQEKDLRYLGGHPVRLDTARVDKRGNLAPYKERVSFMSESLEVGTYPEKIGSVRHARWLKYSADTKPGDCGALLSLQDHSAFACRTLMGLHVGRKNGTRHAYAITLTQELVAESLGHIPDTLLVKALTLEETFNQSGIKSYDLTSSPTEEMPFEIEENSNLFGSMEPVAVLSQSVSAPIRTNKVITGMGSDRLFEPVMEAYYGEKPEPLEIMKLAPYYVDGEKKYPMKEALLPFATETRSINVPHFQESVQVAMQPFNNKTMQSFCRKLTVEEAILGVPALGLNSIPRSTSVGIPLGFRYKTKKEIFGEGDEFDLTTPEAKELIEDVLALEKLILDGKRPFFMCRGFLKDEVRKKGKGARYIAGVDLRYYILCRMYFGAYVAALQSNHESSGVCSAINPYKDWGWLKRHVTQHGPDVWDGDFKQFDSSEQSQMLWCLNDEINRWYSVRSVFHGWTVEGDNAARKVLFMDLTYSRHVVSQFGAANCVVQWQKSLPSGHFLTSTVNSMLSLSCIVSGYIATVGDRNFWQNASAASCGDDNLVNASKAVLDRFNQRTLALHLSEAYGMTYTAGKKGADLVESLTIEEVVFLQRNFRMKNDEVVCPIRPESFLNSLYYTKKGTVLYRREVLLAGLENALSELSMHTEDMWQMTVPLIVREMASFGVCPELSVENSSEYLEKTLNREDYGFC